MDKEIDYTNFITLLHKAKEEAIARGINANTIIIDEQLRYVKPFVFAEFPPVVIFPPMIMGMEIKVSKLPAGADLTIYENPRREQKKIIDGIQKRTAEKILNEFSRFSAISSNFAKVWQSVYEEFFHENDGGEK